LQDLADGVRELDEVITQFQRDESVDGAPELGGNVFGILIAADVTAAH
jgi:hypothetical protein